ncbi:hypothetical protein BHE74_00046658 [Ensete ventricosum]|nr:hypothetical protein GW17_00025133 [Ensete ventricosum]RWW47362.1 hypothetical protein BHE74_00046658 [Ensete ventricosum]RZS12178.1 hypothetical protein BHM03_00043589 [Ensete ventricosum]
MQRRPDAHVHLKKADCELEDPCLLILKLLLWLPERSRAETWTPHVAVKNDDDEKKTGPGYPNRIHPPPAAASS